MPSLRAKAAYRQRNRERLREASRVYYAANKEAQKQRVYSWKARHPDVFRSISRRGNRARRARKRNAPGEPINETYVYWSTDGHCGPCGDPIDFSKPARHPLSLTLDHIRPLARGGSNYYENLQPAHYGCNSSKGARESPSPP